MSSWTEKRLTDVVRRHDEKLFVQKNYQGVLQVLRENFVLHAYDVNGKVIHALAPAPHYVMALTDTWAPNGRPVDWGVEPLLERLKFIDGWSKQSFVNSEMALQNEKSDQSKKRDFANKTEAFAYEFRDSFKKTFSDINTASMEKIERRK